MQFFTIVTLFWKLGGFFLHSWREYAIIQANFKLGAFEENKGQYSL